MQKVEPQVYCIAETKINPLALDLWLNNSHWDECKDNVSGTDAEKIIELSGKRCYKSYKVGGENSNPNITKIRIDSKEYIGNILKSGHGSVLQHSSSTWAVENVTRVFSHELIRHSAGTAFSMESGRYCRIEEIKYYSPPEIEEKEEAQRLFEETMTYLEEQQRRLAKLYDIDNIKDFNAKKLLTSAFRRLAPEGMTTGIVVTFNMRALRWVIENRTTVHAEREIRLVFNKIADIAVMKWPFIFQDFKKMDSGDGLFEWVPEYKKV